LNELNPKISIIIVNLNTGNLLLNCVNSIYEYEAKNNLLEVIIVDQNSSDNSKDVIHLLSEKYENIKYILNDSLMGFSYANNQGYDISTGSYILIMNPDVVFIEPILANLLKSINNSKLGAVCPILNDKNGNFQQEYFRKYPSIRQYILFYMFFSKPFYRSSKLRSRFFEIDRININSGKLEFVEQIPCAFFLTRREIFESVGKMDDNYILFYEDVDLSFQINKKYKLAIDTSVKLLHLGGQSFNSENNWWLFGRFMMSMNHFFEKNKGAFKSYLLKIFSVSNSLFIVAFERIKILFGKKDSYRLNKHKYYLQEFRKVYL
jgi:N-acetylglucosaminyl-diphospho-decaprenol L-rhamnosyltransferase